MVKGNILERRASPYIIFIFKEQFKNMEAQIDEILQRTILGRIVLIKRKKCIV